MQMLSKREENKMRNITHIIIPILVSIFFFAINSNAEFKNTNPSEVCNYLKDIGLTTNGWKKYEDDNWGCTSQYKEIGRTGPTWAPGLKNNLSYYGEGTATVVHQIKLVLNVNNRSEAKSAHSDLIKAAELLVKKALKESLPTDIRNAIMNAENASSKIGSAIIDVIHEVWPTGKGYETQIIIRPCV
jgi:hypothetical protein